ncbi:MAG TPA: hypothetical protein VGK15_01815 [Candidatus Limnocylindria bacterium]
MLSTRGTVALLVAFGAFIALALPLDREGDGMRQSLLGLSAWLFLGVALALQPRELRVQVLVLVGVATVLEVIGSILWGAYRYRLDNLPLYVPAGHGLFYLSALRVSRLPIVERHGRAIVVAVTAGATAYMLRNLVAPPLPDLLGFVTWAIFLRFILRGTAPLLYAVSFAMTSLLELYGTGLGIWTWQPVLPLFMLPAANPPSGVGAGYAAMDALTRRIVKRLREPRVVGPELGEAA